MYRVFRSWVDTTARERDLVMRGGVERFALRNVVKIFVAAEIADFAVHLVLAGLGVLPYPLMTALVIGSFVTAVVSGIVGFYFMWLVGRAIRDLATNRDEFQRLSETDHLTGLLNLRAFFASITAEASQGACLVFDIDHFKAVNDRFGHGAGDDVICAVGARLTDIFRACSGRVGRIGGEEFAVFIDDIAHDRRVQLAERARLAVCSSLIATRAGPIAVTISGGLAHHAPHRPVQALFGACDDALYRAKAIGRNCVINESEALRATGIHAVEDTDPTHLDRSDARSDQIVPISNRITKAA